MTVLRAAQFDERQIIAAAALAPRAFARPLPERLLRSLPWLACGALTLYCLVIFDFSPLRIWSGLDSLGVVFGLMVPPRSNGFFLEFAYAILETLAMAFLGTLLASVFGFFLAFLAARNVLPSWLLRSGVRRGFDFLRGVDVLIWALVFVRAVGLGPLAGILAIAVSDTGTLGKLFSEAIENARPGPFEGVRAAGCNKVKGVRFGLLPQVLPVMLSNALYMFESNTRSATILGIVGAGGIGFQLADRIRAHRWDEACAIILMVLVTVYGIDMLSRRLRMKLIGGG
jgi:phosphonate transport system permease protein